MQLTYFWALVWLSPFFVLTFLSLKSTLTAQSQDIVKRLDVSVSLVFSALAIRLVVRLFNFHHIRITDENSLFLTFTLVIVGGLLVSKERNFWFFVKGLAILILAVLLTSWLLFFVDFISIVFPPVKGKNNVLVSKLPPGTRTKVVKKIVVIKKGQQAPPNLVKIIKPKPKKLKRYKPAPEIPVTEAEDVDLFHLLPRRFTDWHGLELKRVAPNMVTLKLAANRTPGLVIVVTVVGLHNSQEAKDFFSKPVQAASLNLNNQRVYLLAYQDTVTVWWHMSRFAFEIQATGSTFQELRQAAVMLANQIIADAPL